MTILTSWKACVVMIETTCPVKIFAQCVCWELFHHITPSVSSMWFRLSSTYMLYFLVFLFFCDDFNNWEYYCESAIIFCGQQTPPDPFNLSLPVHEPWCIYQKQYMFFEDCGQWVSSCWISTTLFLFLMHLYSSTSDAEPGKAYRWRGAPVPCVCWYLCLQTSIQENIVSRSHTLPMSVWYDFHWHHLRRNRCMKPSVVAMQKTVSLCCDLYQTHHVCTCGLATGDTVCWS